MTLQILLDYSERVRELLDAALIEVTPEQWTREFPNIGHTTLRDTLLHNVSVEDGWLQWDILRRQVDWSQYDPERFPTPASVFEKWAVVRQRTVDFIAERGPDGLQEMVELLDDDSGRPYGRVRIEDVLLHVLLHEIAHLGDVTTLMSLNEIAVPRVDHIALILWGVKQLGHDAPPTL